jgi:Amt family ammonium transporter
LGKTHDCGGTVTRRIGGHARASHSGARRWNGVSNGLFYGNAAQLGHQALAVLAAPTYAFVVTFVLLKLIGLVTGEGAILITDPA